MSKLVNYLPDIYNNATTAKEVLEVMQTQLDQEGELQNNVKDSMLPSTAVYIEKWEQEYDVAPVQQIEQRRRNVVAKRRGTGITKKGKIEDIIASYSEGEVKATENNDDSMVNVSITSKDAFMQAEDEMKEAVYRVLPAHLDFRYRYERPIEKQHYIAAIGQTVQVQKIETPVRRIK